MGIPQFGDIVVQGTTANGYVLVDAITQRTIAGPVTLCAAAVALARALSTSDVWHQSMDNRGRPLGEPYRLTKRAQP